MIIEENLTKIYQEVLDKNLSTHRTIDEFNKYRPVISNKPKRPFLKNSKDLKEVEEYVLLLKRYEEELKEYNRNYKTYKEEANQIEELKVKYIKHESGLNKIPTPYHEKVYKYAYREGHSNGYSEILNILYDLVDIFNV